MLKQWKQSLISDLALLAGLKINASKNGADSMRAANIRATEERIKQAQHEIEKAGRK